MKKILFVFILLLLPTIVMADDATIPVVFSPGASNHGGHGRGDFNLPIVSFSVFSNSLTVEYESEDSYLLEIKDINGTTWYSGPLNTSGLPAVYYVNLQLDNTYVITISSVIDSFYGILEI